MVFEMPARPYRTRARIGFTLVELLVVIAVIALLMSMLVPALRKAKEAANVAVCASNIKQMHIALHAGLVDRTSGRLPTTAWGPPVAGPRPGVGGYQGDQFGFHAHEMEELGWTFEGTLCPGITPDTGGDRRRSFWYTRKSDGGGLNGSDYLYTGGRGDHPAAATDPSDRNYAHHYRMAFGYPRFGFVFPKHAGIYYALNQTYSGKISHDENGQNPYREEAAPSEVTYLSDVTYNDVSSYPGWYYNPYVDPSNHRDTSVADHRKGNSLWPAIGRGSNRGKADGSIEWWNFPVKGRGRPSKMDPDGSLQILQGHY